MILVIGEKPEKRKPTIIKGHDLNQITMIKLEKCTDERFPDRTSFKIRAYNSEGFQVDLKVGLHNRSVAQAYLNEIAEEITSEGADHIVIVSEL